MDMWTELQKQEEQSDAARLARAKTGASSEVRQRLASFVTAGADQQERDVRIMLAEGSIREITAANAQAHGVDEEAVFEAVRAKLAAETAVTKPETKKVDSPIGGEEGKKYEDNKEAPKVDGKTDTSELKPVVENPVRHKEETVDLDSDTQADNKPGKGAGSSDSKSFPNG